MLTVTNYTDNRESTSDADFATILALFTPCGWAFSPWADDTTPRTQTALRFRYEFTGRGLVGKTVDAEGRCTVRGY